MTTTFEPRTEVVERIIGLLSEPAVDCSGNVTKQSRSLTAPTLMALLHDIELPEIRVTLYALVQRGIVKWDGFANPYGSPRGTMREQRFALVATDCLACGHDIAHHQTARYLYPESEMDGYEQHSCTEFDCVTSGDPHGYGEYTSRCDGFVGEDES